MNPTTATSDHPPTPGGVSPGHTPVPVNLMEVPSRMRFAMDFLVFCFNKEMPKGIVAGENYEWGKGTELSHNEKSARDSAAMALSQYFSGTWEPNQAETIGLAYAQQRLTAGPLPKATVINCIVCSGPSGPRPGCSLCDGAGALMVYPYNRVPKPE